MNLPYMLQTLAHQLLADATPKPDENRLAEAERLISEAKTLFLQHYGENHVATVSADASFAALAQARGDLGLAERLSEEVLRRYRQVEDGSHSYINALVALGGIKRSRGNVVEADTLFAQALDMGRTQWGADHSRFIGPTRDIDLARYPRTENNALGTALR